MSTGVFYFYLRTNLGVSGQISKMDEDITLQDHSIQVSLWKLFQGEILTDVTIVVLEGRLCLSYSCLRQY